MNNIYCQTSIIQCSKSRMEEGSENDVFEEEDDIEIDDEFEGEEEFNEDNEDNDFISK